MTAGLAQWGVKAETTYGTPVTVDRFMALIEDGLEPVYEVVEAEDEMYAGSLVQRVSQADPYIAGVSGSIKAYVPTSGFGLYLKHALGAASVGTVSDSNYTQTHTLSGQGKYGLSLTGQSGRPLNPSGTVQPFTWHGLKILSLELALEREGFLTTTIEFDGEDVGTGVALATASYPAIAAGAQKFPWRTATLEVDSSAVEVTAFSVKVTWPMKTDRRYLRGSALKKEPVVSGKAMVEWSFEADFADLSDYNRFAGTNIDDRIGAIDFAITGIAALGGTTLPQLTVSLPAARWDAGPPTVSGYDPLIYSASGIALDNDSDEPITITYRTTDAAV